MRTGLIFAGTSELIPAGAYLFLGDRSVLSFRYRDELIEIVPLDLARNRGRHIGGQPGGPAAGRGPAHPQRVGGARFGHRG